MGVVLPFSFVFPVFLAMPRSSSGCGQREAVGEAVASEVQLGEVRLAAIIQPWAVQEDGDWFVFRGHSTSQRRRHRHHLRDSATGPSKSSQHRRHYP